MPEVTDVCRALSDPIRLHMIERLTDCTGCTLGELSKGLGVTRQGARKHLLILEHAQIIQVHKHGRRKEVQFQPASLESMKSLISKLEAQWDQRLLVLKTFVENAETKT